MLRADVGRTLFRVVVVQTPEGEFGMPVVIAKTRDARRETRLRVVALRNEVLLQSVVAGRANVVGQPLQIVIANVLVMAEGAGDGGIDRRLRFVMYRARMAGQTRLARDRMDVAAEIELHESFERSPVVVTLGAVVGEELMSVREFAALEDVILAPEPLQGQPKQASDREPQSRPPSPPTKAVSVLLGVLFDSFGKFATGENDGHGVLVEQADRPLVFSM